MVGEKHQYFQYLSTVIVLKHQKNHIFPRLSERDCVLYVRVRVDLAIAQVLHRFNSCLCAIDSTGITRLLSRYSDNLASFESTLHRVTECILPESQMIRRSNRYNIYFEYVWRVFNKSVWQKKIMPAPCCSFISQKMICRLRGYNIRYYA